MDTPVKYCPKCDTTKPVTEFGRNKGKRNNIRTYCKKCASQWTTDKRNSDPEQTKARRRELYWINREKIREQRRLRRLNNLQSYLAKERHAHSLRKEKSKEYNKKYRKANPEIINAQTRRRKAMKRKAEGVHTAAETRVLFQSQKGKCYYCHKKLINPFTKEGKGEMAHLDHVIPLKRGGRNDIGNLVWACQYCNDSKGSKLPHEWHGNNGRLI